MQSGIPPNMATSGLPGNFSLPTANPVVASAALGDTFSSHLKYSDEQMRELSARKLSFSIDSLVGKSPLNQLLLHSATSVMGGRGSPIGLSSGSNSNTSSCSGQPTTNQNQNNGFRSLMTQHMEQLAAEQSAALSRSSSPRSPLTATDLRRSPHTQSSPLPESAKISIAQPNTSTTSVNNSTVNTATMAAAPVMARTPSIKAEDRSLSPISKCERTVPLHAVAPISGVPTDLNQLIQMQQQHLHHQQQHHHQQIQQQLTSPLAAAVAAAAVGSQTQFTNPATAALLNQIRAGSALSGVLPSSMTAPNSLATNPMALSSPTATQLPGTVGQLPNGGAPINPLGLNPLTSSLGSLNAAAAQRNPFDYPHFYPWLMRQPFFGGNPLLAYPYLPLMYKKQKRVRTAFSPNQLMMLEDAFEKNQYVVGQERKQLAQGLNLTETQVKVWFQNRRTKHKRQKNEEGGEESGKSPMSDKADRCFSDDDELEEDESEIDPDGFVGDEPMDVRHMLFQANVSNGHQLPFSQNAVMAHALAMQAAVANSNNPMLSNNTTGNSTLNGNHKQPTVNVSTSNGSVRSSPIQDSLKTSVSTPTITSNASSLTNSVAPVSSHSSSGATSISHSVSSASSPSNTSAFPQHLFSNFGYLNGSSNTNTERNSLNPAAAAAAEAFLYSRFNVSPLTSQTNQNSATNGLTAQQS